MTKQSVQQLAGGTLDGLRLGDPEAEVDQRLVSAQNYVVGERRGYERALQHRAQTIHVARAAGWSVYRIAKRLGITRRAVDEALARPLELSPDQTLDKWIRENGGHEDSGVTRLREVIQEIRERSDG